MEIKQYISDIYFTLGCEKLDQNDKLGAREALNYFDKVKATMANYPNIDEKYNAAVDLATVKVAIARHRSDDKINVLDDLAKSLNSDRLINVVDVSNSYNSQFAAKQNAIEHGADILVYILTDTKVEAGVAEDYTPLNNNIDAVKGWKIVDKYYEGSSSSKVYYNVIDLATGDSIKNETVYVTNSTDFDFTLTAIEANPKIEKIQLGDMKQARNLKVATLEPDKDEYTLDTQLDYYHNIKFKHRSPAIVLESINDINNSSYFKYKNAQTLSKNKTLNDHVFIPFHLVEMTKYGDKYYSFIYNITYG